MPQASEACSQLFAYQPALGQLPRPSVGQQYASLRGADQGGHGQVLQAIGHEASSIAHLPDRPLQSRDAPLQDIARPGGGNSLGQHLWLLIQARQLPAEVGEHRAEPAPVPQ
ncbi:hypothetical protein D9M68_872710 [compost metagenome]